MNWQQICENPSLKDLPFKIETNEWGQIVMSPASNKHGYLQMTVGLMIMNIMKEGKIISECSLETDKGVKVADLAWCSDKFILKNGYETPYPESPELCVEIISSSNSKDEIEEKTSLYLSKGAREVWTCNLNGRVFFYDNSGKMESSELFPEFPEYVLR